MSSRYRQVGRLCVGSVRQRLIVDVDELGRGGRALAGGGDDERDGIAHIAGAVDGEYGAVGLGAVLAAVLGQRDQQGRRETTPARSAPVRTASTSSAAAVRDVSTDRIRACG